MSCSNSRNGNFCEPFAQMVIVHIPYRILFARCLGIESLQDCPPACNEGLQ